MYRSLQNRGVTIVSPDQTYLDKTIDPHRFCQGAIIHPGARIMGERSFLGPGAEVGRLGPATLINTVLGEGARFDGGTAQGAVLLRGASAGPSSFLREGTLLEEGASVAHSVGLKHTILMAFVTMGSLINFCDALISGGSSRKDHSEVGSNTTHFNFTPWGNGDKATPSICGDVARGVFLQERRIFIGGHCGIIGPLSIGFGALVGAGSIVRQDIQEDHLFVGKGEEVYRPYSHTYLDNAESRVFRNQRYISNLIALHSWYLKVRLPRAQHETFEHVVIGEAIANILLSIEERNSQLEAWMASRDIPLLPRHSSERTPGCPLDVSGDHPGVPHVDWVRGLQEKTRESLQQWLSRVFGDAFS